MDGKVIYCLYVYMLAHVTAQTASFVLSFHKGQLMPWRFELPGDMPCGIARVALKLRVSTSNSNVACALRQLQRHQQGATAYAEHCCAD